eukprot:708770-Pyramimonas_sp.AAC.1
MQRVPAFSESLRHLLPSKKLSEPAPKVQRACLKAGGLPRGHAAPREGPPLSLTLGAPRQDGVSARRRQAQDGPGHDPQQCCTVCLPSGRGGAPWFAPIGSGGGRRLVPLPTWYS